MKMSNKHLIIMFSFLIVLFIFVFKKWPDRSIKITYCDVGQGDSILIQQGFFQLLIDSGDTNRLLGCLGNVLPFWDQVIEVGIISHFDKDHMGYFGEIMGIYQFKELYFIYPNKNNQLVKEVLQELEKASGYGLKIKQPVLGQSIVLSSGAKFTFLEVTGITEKNELAENDRTLGGLLETEATKWLFTGDGEKTWENLLISKNVLPQVDVLKVGHHGSSTSSTTEFLNKVLPKVGVISVGNNSFGHPNEETLDKLKNLGAKVFRTDDKGDITFKILAEQITIDSFVKRP